MNKHYPKISVITPSFNQGQYIEQTIKSILDQNYPNLEYIILDGGSTDNTLDVIKKYKDSLSYWISEPDNGQADAINKGLHWIFSNKQTNESTNQQENHLINWINSDDYLEPGALFALAKAWCKNPQGQVFCGYTRCFWEGNNKTSHTYRMGLKKSATDTLLNIEMNQPGTFYAASVLKALGDINESLRYVFDNELWMRHLCKFGQKKVVRLKETIAHFRQHGNSKSFGEGFDAFNKEQQNILKFLCIQTRLPHYLQTYVDRDTPKLDYMSNNWDISHLNIDKFHGWFANKYMVSLLNDHKKQECKKSLLTALKTRQLSYSRKAMGLIKKLIFTSTSS